MIDLRKGLPNAIVSADGNPIFLNTDYRLWIRFEDDLKRNEKEDIDISYLFVDEPPIIDEFIYGQLINFLYNPSVTPKSDSTGEKTLDYVLDGEYIYSAIFATYGIDIIDMDMHWHKFQALCNNIISDKTLWGYAKQMRGYKKPSKNDTYEKQCAKAKDAWSFPIELTEEEQEKVQEFDDYFN